MVDPDIRKAHTLPAEFYQSEENFILLRDHVFRKSWNYAGAFAEGEELNVKPVSILEGLLDDPVVITRDRHGDTHCLSNVCTHRANLVVENSGKEALLRCRYHGRCFGLDGSFRSMPGFEGVAGFPSEEDNLTQVRSEAIGPMQFLRLQGDMEWNTMFGHMLSAMSWVDHDRLTYRPTCSRDYYVDAHWALYVDNYLEGFHVPYVHPGLNEALEVESYQVELFDGGALQVGVADDGETNLLDIPAGSGFDDKRIYALYWWLFPNLMFNYYPWGISLNVVEPISIDRTRIRFLTFAYRESPDPDVSSIHQTEMEDEKVVEGVARGLRSSFYKRGRFSPVHEKAVHHFHYKLFSCLAV